MAVHTKGLRDIHTLSGRKNGDQVSAPYRIYMRISAIEMEKARRGKEKESAVRKVEGIDARLEEIENEKEALLLDLPAREDKGPINKTKCGPKPASRRSNGGFRIRY